MIELAAAGIAALALAHALRERKRRRDVQRALSKACRLARIARAWDPLHCQDPEFLTSLAEYEKLALHEMRTE